MLRLVAYHSAVEVIIYAPENLDGFPRGAKIYRNVETFAAALLDVFNNPRPVLVYMDEGGDLKDTYRHFDRFPWHIKMLTRKGRHKGITVWIATQRPQDVHPQLRNNCKEWIAFRCGSKNDAEIVAERSMIKSVDDVPLTQLLVTLPSRTFYRIVGGEIQLKSS